MTVIVVNLGNVPFFFLGNDIDTHGKGVRVTILSLFSTAPGTLVILVLLPIGGGCLLSGR